MIRLKSLLAEASETTAIPDSIQWAKKFKQDLGLTDEAAAAMAANIQHESGFIPDRIQGAGIKTGPMSQSNKLGYSWAQWTFGPRKQNFRDFVKSKFDIDILKTSPTSKHAYAFLKHEVKNYPGFDFDSFKKMQDVDTATELFVSKYEQAGKPMLQTRQAIARDILSKIKTKTTEPKSTGGVESGVLTAINKSTYVVKAGETLSGIAKRNNTTVDDIVKKNPGLDADRIQIGQKIMI
jgi:LysM repeat protein